MPSQGCSDGPPRLAAAGSNRHRHIFRSPGRPPGPYRQLLWRLRPLPPYRLRQEFKDRVKPPLPSCEKAPPAANQKSTGKAAFYGPCKIRDAGRRPNRPTGGFSGLRPLAPLLHRLPLTLPRGGLPSGQKFTFIADKIAGTTPPCLSQKPSNIIANNLRFSREPLFERGSPPPSLRRGLFFWWITPSITHYTKGRNLPQFSITQPHLSQKPPAAVANQ